MGTMPRVTPPRRRRPRTVTPICPACGSTFIRPIIYGFPDADLGKKADRGEVVLGGCVVVEEQPRWSCGTCDHRWR